MISRALKRLVGAWVAPLLNLGLRLTGREIGVALAYHTIDTRQGDPTLELVPRHCAFALGVVRTLLIRGERR